MTRSVPTSHSPPVFAGWKWESESARLRSPMRWALPWTPALIMIARCRRGFCYGSSAWISRSRLGCSTAAQIFSRRAAHAAWRLRVALSGHSGTRGRQWLSRPFLLTGDTASTSRSRQPGRCRSTALDGGTRCPGSLKGAQTRATKSQVFLSGSSSCPRMKHLDTLKTGRTPSSTACFRGSTPRLLRSSCCAAVSARPTRAADIATRGPGPCRADACSATEGGKRTCRVVPECQLCSTAHGLCPLSGHHHGAAPYLAS